MIHSTPSLPGALVGLLFWAVAASGTGPSSTTDFHALVDAEAPVGATLVVGKTDQPLRIDGKPNDACWKDDAGGRAPFVKADGSGRPTAPSRIQVCHDDTNLYLMFHAGRAGGDGVVPSNPARHDDGGLFQGDALQVFLQPGGKGTRFYQIAMNPAGGVYDLSFTPDNGWMRDKKWNADGIRVAGVTNKTGYFVEAAIPLAALGVGAPKAGDVWRANFCRSDHSIHELSSWSPAGKRFDTPTRFGTLVFADRAVASAHQQESDERAAVEGTLVRADGKPAAHVLVRTVDAQGRSDADGHFQLKSVATGKRKIGMTSPQYETRVGEIEVRNGKNLVAPITMTPVDAYRPAFDGPLGREAVTWLKSDIVQPFDMKAAQPPGGDELAGSLIMLGAPGQCVSRGVAFYLNDDVVGPKVSIQWSNQIETTKTDTDLSGSVRWISHDLDRQYYLPRETSQWSWRFAWLEPPKSLKKGHVRMLVLTLRIPENAKPGRRQGQLVLHSGDRAIAALPLSLSIVPFRLTKPAKRLGVYYYSGDFENEWSDLELKDIRAHGGSLLMAGRALRLDLQMKDGEPYADVSAVVTGVRQLRTYGFPPPYIIQLPAAGMGLRAWRDTPGKHMTPRTREQKSEAIAMGQSSPAYPPIVRAMADALDRAQKQSDGAPLMVQWMDEVFNQDRFPRWITLAKLLRPMTNLPVYVTMNNRPANLEMIKQADPYLDIRAYHGPTLDQWLAQGHTWDELAAELKASGDTGWTYYNDRGLEFTPEDQRLTCGYWLWRSPLMANIPWVYNPLSATNDPLDTMDNATGDIGMAFRDPKHHQLVSTLDWEAYRQGYNDLCYLATLEQAISQAPGTPEAAKASQWLATLRAGPATVEAMNKALSAQDYHRRRRQMAQFIEVLHAAGLE